MRVLKYSFLVIIFMFIGVLALSNNKEIKDETCYALKQDYSYLYDETENMNVMIYSNIINPRFSYITRNKYYLSDYKEEFYIPADVSEVSFEKTSSGYLYNLVLKVPNFTEIYIDDLYLNASNDYSYDRFMIGSLSIISDIYSDDELIQSLSKISDDNLFEGISIMTSSFINIEEIIISNAYQMTYSQNGKNINIMLNSKNYTYKLYLIIKTNKGNIKIDNYIINNLKINFSDNENYYSIMERRQY